MLIPLAILIGDFEFPEIAPLISPALDNLPAEAGEEDLKMQDKLKKSVQTSGDDRDRRARAAYASCCLLLMVMMIVVTLRR